MSTPFSTELPTNAITGYPYPEHIAPIAIFNGQGSGVKLNLKLLNCRPNTMAQALVSTLEFRKITAITGGTPVYPVKHDSADADMPSQVVSVFAPLSVTGTTPLRRAFICSGASFTRPLANLTSMLNGDSRTGFDSGEFVKMTGEPELQKHTLNEGEGIAITFTANGPTFAFGLSVMVRDRATNQCYRFNDMVEPRFMSGETAWALLNGAGSGVVLEVLRIQIRELGTDEIPFISYEPIDGIAFDGEDAVYVMADSADTLPTNVFIKKNSVTMRAGSKYGGFMSLPAMRRVTLGEPPFGPGIAGGPQIARRGLFSPDMDTRGSAPITLSEGQGIALFIRNASAQLYHEFTATVDIETTEGGGTAEATSFGFVQVGGEWKITSALAVQVNGEWQYT